VARAPKIGEKKKTPAKNKKGNAKTNQTQRPKAKASEANDKRKRKRDAHRIDSAPEKEESVARNGEGGGVPSRRVGVPGLLKNPYEGLASSSSSSSSSEESEEDTDPTVEEEKAGSSDQRTKKAARKRGYTNGASKRSNKSGDMTAGSSDDDESDSEDEGPPDGPPEILFYGDSLTYGMAHDRAGRYDTPWPRLLAEQLQEEEGLTIVESAMCSRTTQFDDLKYTNKDWLPKMRPHFFNGARHLIPTMLCHTPHWLVLLLGTNDLQKQIQTFYKRRRLAAATKHSNHPDHMSGSSTSGRAAQAGGYHNQADSGDGYHSQNASSSGLSTRLINNYPPEKCAEEIALSVVAMAYEAKKYFPKVRAVVMTPPPFRLTEDNKDWGFNEKSVQIANYFPYAFGKMCRLHGIANVCYPENSIDMNDSVDGVHITEAQNQVLADALGKFISSYKCQRPQRRRRTVQVYCPNEATGQGAYGGDFLAKVEEGPQYTFS
jgi:lysophospholipase L1-like esterase